MEILDMLIAILQALSMMHNLTFGSPTLYSVHAALGAFFHFLTEMSAMNPSVGVAMLEDFWPLLEVFYRFNPDAFFSLSADAVQWLSDNNINPVEQPPVEFDPNATPVPGSTPMPDMSQP